MDKLILLTGVKGSGKDTIATELIRYYGPDRVKRYAFADPLKAELSKLLKVPLAELEENKAFFRPILTWYGTEFKREYRKTPHIWVNKLLNELKKDLGSVRIGIITDLRFHLEYEALKDFTSKNNVEVVLIRLERRSKFQIFCDRWFKDHHPSETEFLDWPAHIVKNKYVYRTVEQVFAIVEKL
jgi:hypothetical protein